MVHFLHLTKDKISGRMTVNNPHRQENCYKCCVAKRLTTIHTHIHNPTVEATMHGISQFVGNS